MNPLNLIPVQAGEPFHCWECDQTDAGGMYLLTNHPQLAEYAAHVYYMKLSCGHNNRCVRLGDVVVPLAPLNKSIEANLVSIREGLEFLQKSALLQEWEPDPITRICSQLAAGRISAQVAVFKLREFISQEIASE